MSAYQVTYYRALARMRLPQCGKPWALRIPPHGVHQRSRYHGAVLGPDGTLYCTGFVARSIAVGAAALRIAGKTYRFSDQEARRGPGSPHRRVTTVLRPVVGEQFNYIIDAEQLGEYMG